MEFVRALVLGVVQGLTEFVPVSSSGHLVLVRRLFGWADDGLPFDAALHLGTLLAVLWYFRSTWLGFLRRQQLPLLGALLLATVPAAVVGLAGEALVATALRGMRPLGAAFLFTAGALLLAERVAAKRTLNSPLSTLNALLIGLAQILALVPGVSRSGIAIAAGMLLGLPRPRAVEFAFLLALPLTAVAALEGLRQVVALSPAQLVPLGMGILAAAVSGTAAIGFLLRMVRARALTLYALYLLVVGLLVVLWGDAE